MTPPEPARRQQYRAEDVGLAIIRERVTALDKRLADHAAKDDQFQEQIMAAHAEVGRTLKAIEIGIAGWRGTAIAAVAAVSAVWAVVVVVLQFWSR